MSDRNAEGPNIGPWQPVYDADNQYGFIETSIAVENGRATDRIFDCGRRRQFHHQANEPFDPEISEFLNKRVSSRYKEEILLVPSEQIDYMDVSPKQIVSIATALIPFLENDDASRALMGSNMQRQAVPLIRTEAPLVGTGMEYKAAVDSGVVVLAKEDGEVVSVTADEIVVKTKKGDEHRYRLTKFARSNQGTCINQKPLVTKGQQVKAGDVLADGPSTDRGELALGRNVLVAFMPWEGYNFEDAIVISEKLVKDDIFTSIHIEEYEAQARDTKLGARRSPDIPNVGEDQLKTRRLGIIRIGAEVRRATFCRR